MLFFQIPDVLASSASKMKKGNGSASEKAKQLKYLHLTSVQRELQLTKNAPLTPINNFVETKQSLLICTGFWIS